MRVGIFGGTFNPPHLGHLRLAEEVACLHGLDRVTFIPCHIPPHKEKSALEIAPAEDRLQMTRLACAGNPLFAVSDVEIMAEGPSYTVKTLAIYSEKSDVEPFFILGTDSLRELPTWKDYERLFELSHFIAVSRPGTEFRAAWAELPTRVRDQFVDRGDFYFHASEHCLIPSSVNGLDISSTRIRELIRKKHSIRYLIPEEVRSYILETNLYGN